ncbi:MAG: PPOX class F420-dependent oxidoreductase [Acidimicrobiales bacterium]|nr:PPOX class F420-dependent oxidoreductase [Acidimicrobiales bacterium]MCB9395656.1 PPOX class F420-dependent oxidoreductase [Acidimicrobiaceae bacterium]
MELDAALRRLSEVRQAILVTLKRDGRPQSSNIVAAVGSDGVVRISITADRAKYHNLRRDPRATLHVNRADFWAYAVVEGTAELSPVAADPADGTVDELVELYRSLSGEHPDWSEYRAAMVRDRRLVVRLQPERAYGMWPDEQH